MPFLANIPLSTDQLSISQGNILNNFTILGAIAGNINAASAAVNATSGFNWIYLPNNGATPPAGSSFPAGDIALYASLNGTTNQNELYINKTNQATVVQIPATASILSANSAPAALSSGWTYLPSGILLKWAANQTANGLTVVNFPTGANIPAFTTCITVIPQIANGGAGDANQAIRLTGVNPTNFSVYGSPRTTTGASAVTFTYIAIGY
jgi:hypothetical protein